MAELEQRGRRIAVAVDESEESMHALSWCLHNLIKDDYSTIILLYARPPPPVYASGLDGTGHLFSGEVVAILDKYGRDLAETVMERAHVIYQGFRKVRVEQQVGTGDAGGVLCHMVEKIRPDMLVMGSHGYGFIKRALLGSVSEHCSKHVKCPVLIVKRPQN